MSLPYRHVVILTGAGISAESGIQTFRAQDGLWENHRIEDVATPEGFSVIPIWCWSFITSAAVSYSLTLFSLTLHTLLLANWKKSCRAVSL